MRLVRTLPAACAGMAAGLCLLPSHAASRSLPELASSSPLQMLLVLGSLTLFVGSFLVLDIAGRIRDARL